MTCVKIKGFQNNLWNILENKYAISWEIADARDIPAHPSALLDFI
jgi:hypothetical protein